MIRRSLMAAVLALAVLAPLTSTAATPPTVSITSPEDLAAVPAVPAVKYTPAKPGNPPTVTVTNNVEISGTASDDVSVLGITLIIYTLDRSQGYPATCTGCGTGSATWTVTQDLLPGTYVLEAVAVNSTGMKTSSERYTIFVV